VSPLVTVLVCTYRRRERILACLDSLSRLRFPAGGLELLVVDDGSDDGTAEDIGRRRIQVPVRVLRQAHAGLAAARNTGIRSATGQIIVMVDDDTVAHPDLASEHWLSHCDSDRAVVMGWVRHVIPGGTAGYLPRLSDLSTSFFWTANVSVARRHLLEAGLFYEGFAEYGWEDLEMGDRLRERGLRRRRNWRAIVDHVKPPPTPSSLPAMMARAEASGRSAVVYLLRRPCARTRLATGLTRPRRALFRQLDGWEARLRRVVSRAPEAPLHGAGRIAAELLSGIHYYRSAGNALDRATARKGLMAGGVS